MTNIHIKNISYNIDGTSILKNISCDILTGKVITLLGSSGCGKSTLLRIISGLLLPDYGEIILDSELSTKNKSILIPAHKRKISYMFQDYSLFPHMNVIENIVFSDINKSTKSEKVKKAEGILDEINLIDHKFKMPHDLSGGEQQRVALGCSLMQGSDIFLLDEPFSHLDSRLRENLCEDIIGFLKQKGKTVLMVTHDPNEAMLISDNIILLEKGEIIQSGTPEELYNNPKNIYVASFMGNINVISGDKFARYDDFYFTSKEDADFKSILVKKSFLGSHYLCQFESDKKTLRCNLKTSDAKLLNIGDEIGLKVK